jgi:hypothetical protein
MKLNCPKCAVVVTIDDEGPFIFNNALCAELAGTEYQFKPEWCPVLSDAAPDDVYLLPAGYRSALNGKSEETPPKPVRLDPSYCTPLDIGYRLFCSQ